MRGRAAVGIAAATDPKVLDDLLRVHPPPALHEEPVEVPDERVRPRLHRVRLPLPALLALAAPALPLRSLLTQQGIKHVAALRRRVLPAFARADLGQERSRAGHAPAAANTGAPRAPKRALSRPTLRALVEAPHSLPYNRVGGPGLAKQWPRPALASPRWHGHSAAAGQLDLPPRACQRVGRRLCHALRLRLNVTLPPVCALVLAPGSVSRAAGAPGRRGHNARTLPSTTSWANTELTAPPSNRARKMWLSPSASAADAPPLSASAPASPSVPGSRTSSRTSGSKSGAVAPESPLWAACEAAAAAAEPPKFSLTASPRAELRASAPPPPCDAVRSRPAAGSESEPATGTSLRPKMRSVSVAPSCAEKTACYGVPRGGGRGARNAHLPSLVAEREEVAQVPALERPLLVRVLRLVRREYTARAGGR